MKRLVLTEKDFEDAWKLYEAEKIDPITKENMFRGIIYCMLSSGGENYQKQMMVYNRLLRSGLDNPDAICHGEDKLMEIVGKSIYPNMKIIDIYRLALNWPTLDIPYRILVDREHGMDNGFDIRELIVENVSGMGYKCSSLFLRMCGYLDLATIDRWALRMLHSLDYDVKLPESNKKGRGIAKKEYLELEEIIRGLANEYGIEIAIFQMAVYFKYSSWKKGVQLELL